MTTALFTDSMEIESMFSPAPFSKDLPDYFDNRHRTGAVDADHRGPTERSNNLGSINNKISTLNETGVDIPLSSSYPLSSLSTNMSTAAVAAACFQPSALLVSPEDVSSPHFDFSNWESSAMDDMKPVDGNRNVWMQSLPDFEQQLHANDVSHQRRYGQLTPPGDLSPKTQAVPKSYADEDGSESKSGSEDKSSSRKASSSALSSGKRRSTKSSGTSGDASAPAPKRSRKSRRSKPAAGSNNPEEEAKRERFLERNRVAASKCRQKKKEWTSQLEDDERQQKALNSYLKQCVAELKEEMLFLKGECLRHSNCDCVAIRNHMASTIPLMQRPSRALYATSASFSSAADSRSSMDAMSDVASEAAMSDSRPSTANMLDRVDEEDIEELLAASLVHDSPE